MASDPWVPSDAPSRGAPSGAGGDAGDTALPSAITLAKTAIDDVLKNLTPLLLLGLGYFGGMMVVVSLGSVFLVGPMVIGTIVSAVFGSDYEALAALGSMGGFVVGVLLFLVLVMVAAGPMTASTYRALAALIGQGVPPTIGGAFTTARQDVGMVLGGSLLVGVVVGVGLLFCYVPGLVASFVLGSVPMLIAIRRTSPGEAMSVALANVRAHPSWYVEVLAVKFVFLLIASYIPVIGTIAFMVYQIRVFQAAFGLPPQTA